MTAQAKTRRPALMACAALAVGALTLTACGGSTTAEVSGGKKDTGSAATQTGKAVTGKAGRTALRSFNAPAAGLEYVAMGSSFAAGPGIQPVQSSSGAAACARSENNYASIVARYAGANLKDVTCSGATTANILTTNQGAQQPQINAVTPETGLVTITIGGNDVSYLGSLVTHSCQTSGGTNCGTVNLDAINQAFGALTDRLENVVNAVHARAPEADVYLVNYPVIVPDSGTCANVPLTAEQVAFGQNIAIRLAEATATAADNTGATLINLSAASHGHDACSSDPWVEGYRPAAGRAPYHPNENGMQAAASLVKSALKASE
ncbi:SGNH/GDSL hydrolase family protein [Streptomyces acidicola]|uniref:SGNH/GDSL hydrolase family protein n=1 Tax=Streptomyces acidicola TaxID=2596892 RepID=UPI003412C0F9